ncbi:MAG TPA: (2Fe-2S)-binding protein [Anaerolineae bacterium]|nr:(2Fe-2S)-binding protein [Anaerolineae bacterium]
MEQLSLALTVNGEAYQVTTRPYATLLDVLHDQLGLTGTHEGCRMGECGSCSVLLDGHAVNACLVLAPDVEGRAVTTVEGLAENGSLSALQAAFVQCGALQCGYCTSGMLISAAAFLKRVQETPTAAEVRRALVGNLCRCTGYAKIIDAILAVATKSPNEMNVASEFAARGHD